MGERHDITRLSDGLSIVVSTWEPDHILEEPSAVKREAVPLLGAIFLGHAGGGSVYLEADNRAALRRLRDRLNEALQCD